MCLPFVTKNDRVLEELPSGETLGCWIRGLTIIKVTKDSIAARAGLKAGDEITHVNGSLVLTNEDYHKFATEQAKKEGLKLTVNPAPLFKPNDQIRLKFDLKFDDDDEGTTMPKGHPATLVEFDNHYQCWDVTVVTGEEDICLKAGEFELAADDASWQVVLPSLLFH